MNISWAFCPCMQPCLFNQDRCKNEKIYPQPRKLNQMGLDPPLLFFFLKEQPMFRFLLRHHWHGRTDNLQSLIWILQLHYLIWVSFPGIWRAMAHLGAERSMIIKRVKVRHTPWPSLESDGSPWGRQIHHQESEPLTYSIAFLFTYSIHSSSPQDFSYSRYFLESYCKSMQVEKGQGRVHIRPKSNSPPIFLGGRLKHVTLSNNARTTP